ncbi:MAG: phosphatase PAP2 family protein [Terriglobia bacterium]
MSDTIPISLAGPPMVPALGLRSRLSLAEQVTIGFFVYFALAFFGFGLAAPERLLIVALNTLTVATMLILSRAQHVRWLASARDLFPGVIILVAYRESGLLLRPDAAHHLDCLFIQWDRVLLQNEFIQAVLRTGAPGLQHYLEFVYLLCYPLVPLGLAAIYFATRRSSAGEVTGPPDRRPIDDFWGAVLLATLFCYAVYPFFPLIPPRVLFHDVPGPHTEPLLRKWNLWLLDHYSVQACIFPSGHVAAATAVALAVRKHAPRFGALFLFLAASVAAATVYGRYHYAADAIAGALVGIAAYNGLRLFKKERRHAESISILLGQHKVVENTRFPSYAVARDAHRLSPPPLQH